MKIFLTISVLFFLSACQSTLIRSNDSYFESSQQATIEITQALEVPANSARVFLQNGAIIPVAKLDLYSVNCEVEINTVSEARQLIKAEKFNIIAIAQEESPIVMRKPVMVASLAYAWSSESPVDIKRFYRFRLSAQNPDSDSQVRALLCRGAQSEPYQAELPTLEQMRAASGTYIKFNL